MKTNKTILVAILFIIIAGVLFISDILNPIIHPITYLFLMGSSKGKDILFFGLMGFLLITTQLFKDVKVDSKKYLKITLILGSILLISGILLEIIFRYQRGLALNTIFMAMGKTVTSTSILHSHILKSCFGEVLNMLIGPFIGKEINTAIGLYAYIPEVGKLISLLVPVTFITLILSLRDKRIVQSLLISFFGCCFLIGILDGGLFSTPAIAGGCGIHLMVKHGDPITETIEKALKINHKGSDETENTPSQNDNKKDSKIKIIKKYSPFIIVILIVILRFTICIIGANPAYYEVTVGNPADNLELNDFPIKNVTHSDNKTIYIMDSNYNEMKLLNDLRTPLNNSCDYYTVSWNFYSYL